MEDDENYEDPTSSARSKRKTILNQRERYKRPPKKAKTSSKKNIATISPTPELISTPLVDITNNQTPPTQPNNTQPQSSHFNHYGKQKSCAPNTTANVNLLNKFSAVDTNRASTSYLPTPNTQSPFETPDDDPNGNDIPNIFPDDNNDDEHQHDVDSEADEFQASDASSESDDEFQLSDDNFHIGNITFQGTVYIIVVFKHHFTKFYQV
jgi:hypothetical protein